MVAGLVGAPMAIGCCLHQSLAQQVQPGMDREELTQFLAKTESATAAMVTRLRIDNLGRQVIPASEPWTATAWANKTPVESVQASWATFDNRRAIGIAPLGDDMSNDNPRLIQMVWTRREWAERRPRDGSTEYFIAPLPRADAQWEFLSVFNGGVEWRSFAGLLGLSRLTRDYIPLSQASTAETWTFRFAWTDRPAAPQIEICVLGSGTSQRISSVTLDLYSESQQGGQYLFGRKMLLITEWESFAGVQIPSSGLFMQARFDEGGAPVVFCKRVTRIEVSPLADEAAISVAFALPPLKDQDNVVDACYGLAYRVGSRRLLVNHLEVDVERPIDHRITDDLNAIVGDIDAVKDGRMHRASKGTMQ